MESLVAELIYYGVLRTRHLNCSTHTHTRGRKRKDQYTLQYKLLLFQSVTQIYLMPNSPHFQCSQPLPSLRAKLKFGAFAGMCIAATHTHTHTLTHSHCYIVKHEFLRFYSQPPPTPWKLPSSNLHQTQSWQKNCCTCQAVYQGHCPTLQTTSSLANYCFFRCNVM